ncbi:MAG TPA: flagellar motor switch protein FliN [Acidobacteriota bacterium]|nr:flagellar motor switch protein FliN [Acidobacteriota bacterium]
MKEAIIYKDVSEKERVFEVLAVSLESGFTAALGALTKATAFSRCSKVERTSLRPVLESLSTAACAVEIRYQTGLSGSLLFVCRVSDLARLGELLAGSGSTGGETLTPELIESCVGYLTTAIDEANKHFSIGHFSLTSADPELINPDGNITGLEPLHASYEGVLCASYQTGIESVLDCPFFLLADAQIMQSLVASLARNAPAPGASDVADGPRPATTMQEQSLAAVSAELQRGPSRPAKPAAGKSPGNWNIDLLLDVELPIAVSFGECEMQLRDVLKLAAGSVIELDKSVNDPVTVIVNQKPIAKGEVVMIDGNYGVRIIEVESTADRIRSLA